MMVRQRSGMVWWNPCQRSHGVLLVAYPVENDADVADNDYVYKKQVLTHSRKSDHHVVAYPTTTSLSLEPPMPIRSMP